MFIINGSKDFVVREGKARAQRPTNDQVFEAIGNIYAEIMDRAQLHGPHTSETNFISPRAYDRNGRRRENIPRNNQVGSLSFAGAKYYASRVLEASNSNYSVLDHAVDVVANRIQNWQPESP
jgi:hypothetical protein